MAKEISFKFGDIVKLKSGGPDMVLQSENANSRTGKITYTCQWFAGKKLEHGMFTPACLEHKQPEDK